MFFLTGCWDQKEIDKRAYAIGIGLDKVEEEGKIRVTYVIANPEFGSRQNGGTGANEPPREIISFIAEDFISSKETANTIISKEISYDILGFIFVSETLAQEDDFRIFMYDAAKESEIRRDTELIVTKEEALQFLENNQPIFETKLHRFFELITERGMENGMIPPDSTLLYYFRITEAGNDLFLATYATAEKEVTNQNKSYFDDNFYAGELQVEGEINKTQFAGSAVFKDGKMIDKFTAEETRISIFLNNTLHAAHMLKSFPDPFNDKYRIATNIKQKHDSKIKLDLNKSTPSIDVTIPLVIDVLSNHSMIDYFRDVEKRNILKQSIIDYLTLKSEEMINKTQEEYKMQPFGWSLKARRFFLTIPAFKEFDWPNKYPDMDVTVNYKITFGNFGRQSEVPNN